MNEAERQARANISPELLREMERACPTSAIRNIALRDSRAPTGPSSQGIIPSSQQLSNVRGVAGGGSGWMRETPIGPPPGVAVADRLMDAADRADRAELIRREEAIRRAEATRKTRGR